MALDTYENLKASIATWQHRGDTDKFVDDVIDLCEAEIYGNEVVPLRVREMETRATATLTAGSRYIVVPTGYLAMRRLKLTSGGVEYDVRQATPEALNIRTGSGRPQYFAVANQIEFDISPDSAYAVEMLYYKKADPLSAASNTNVILTNYPNLYLWGCRWAAFAYGNEDQMAEVNYQRFLRSIRGANKKDRKGRVGPAPTMRFEGLTP